jgi:phage antirepressor YoqD-like protein
MSMFIIEKGCLMSYDSKYAKSRQQIADEYGICTKTLNKWFRQEGIRIKRGLINPKQQDFIYKKLGIPKNSLNG